MNKLFNYYKNKYKLNIKFKYANLSGTTLGNYELKKGLIRIDKKRIERMIKKGALPVWSIPVFIENKKEALRFVLLHEIKHAIDFKNKIEYLICNEAFYDCRANRWAFRRYKKGLK